MYSSVAPLEIWQEQGIPTYVCSIGGQPLYYNTAYVNRFFQCQSPEIVFVETNNFFSGYRSVKEVSFLFEENIPLMRYHDRWKNLTMADFTQKVEFTHIQRDKGYRYFSEIIPADTSDYMTPTEEVAHIEGEALRQIKKIHAACQQHGAEMVLLSIPSTMNWDYKKHNAVQKLAQELDVAYIDMNLMPEEVPIDWNMDTRDCGDHLNYGGAVKVSAYLAQYLADTGLFRDKRQDPDYASWNDAAADFKAEVAAGNI